MEHIVDDGDNVNIPAPTPEVFAYRTPPVRVKRTPMYARLSFRRTIIPILLTLGVSLPICGAWWLMLDEDHPLRGLSIGYPILIVATGVVLLVLAILNMLQVRHQLQQAPNASR
jgi:hypothetical protein